VRNLVLAATQAAGHHSDDGLWHNEPNFEGMDALSASKTSHRAGADLAAITRRISAIALAVVLIACAGLAPAYAERTSSEFAANLSDAERERFQAYITAQSRHAASLDSYWKAVNDKRSLRKRKKIANQALVADDYVLTFPPAYSGPALTAELAKRWEAFQEKKDAEGPPPTPKPGLKDFLSNARSQFDFVPDQIPEREFKLRYAREALALGLSKDQVVRIYALETSGLGTADMVAGIHPIKKTGKPISTAIGYAQLLAANSTSEIVKSGPAFVERLRRLSASANIDFERAARLNAKIESLKRMIAAARTVPNEWSSHQAYARTAKGMGIHAVNLDGDIGPWLQVIKVNGLRETAARKGMNALAGAEIELMNLAGPLTGIEMMRPVGRKVPTTNFFERQAYARNTIVRGKTAGELILALDQRMEENIKNPGAIEFNEAFDQALAERQSAATAQR
jgi:hypothetical protein